MAQSKERAVIMPIGYFGKEFIVVVTTNGEFTKVKFDKEECNAFKSAGFKAKSDGTAFWNYWRGEEVVIKDERSLYATLLMIWRQVDYALRSNPEVGTIDINRPVAPTAKLLWR